MSKATTSRRGQPLMVYALLIVGWIGIRSVLWDSPLPESLASMEAEALAADRFVQEDQEPAVVAPQPHSETAPPQLNDRLWRSEQDWRIAEPLDRELLQPVAYREEARDPEQPLEFSDGSVAAGHQLMWMAAMAHFPMLKSVDQDDDTRLATAPNPWLPVARSPGLKRWSLDAWVFLREDSRTLSNQPGVRPSYGRSQHGALLRYRLADAGGREPSLYARYTRALAGVRETDLAAGVQAKPFAGLPIRAHAELRARIDGGRTDWRPAAFVTAGVYEQLPQGIILRGYGQAGYVGGDFATAFVDGQLVADREVARFDLGKLGQGKLNLGAGAWGGAQKGTERVDIGPSANVVLPVGEAPVRLQVDYRWRVAGDAEPDSGVALTLSSGF